MKILHVISYLDPKFGGDVNVCTGLSKELVKREHEVTILTTDYGSDPHYIKKLHILGIDIISLHCIANFGLFLYTPQIKKWLKNNLAQFDIIHFHNYRSYQNILIHKYAIKYGIPYIIQAHGSVLPFFEKKILKRLFDLFWGYKIITNASQFIALSDIEAEQYQIMGVSGERIQVIPNGLDPSQFLNMPKKGKFRTKYSISPKDKIILFLGRIHKIKGLDLLIAAYPKLLNEFPDVQLIIVGPDDNYLYTLKEQINKLELNKKPIFTGPLYNQEKLEVFNDADIYILPSLYDTFPITLLEAMMCEIPVIITNGVKNFEWVHNQTGFVIKNNVDSLVEKTQILLNDDEMRSSFGKTGKRIVQSNFNLKLIVISFEMLYLQLIKKSI